MAVLLLARQHEARAVERRRVGHDGPDARAELEVLQHERGAQGDVSYGRVTRVVFLGRRALFGAHVLSAPVGGVEPAFVEARGRGDDPAALRGALAEHAPDVVVVLRPDAIPPGALAGLDAQVLGVVTDPLQGNAYNQAELARAEVTAFDRVIVTDPRSIEPARALGLPVWRSLPLPVDDALYRAPRPSARPPRIIYLGHSTMHREETLIGLKHEFDLPHYAYGLLDDDLRDVLHAADAGLVVGNDPGLGVLDHTMLVHLAAGHLVVAEPPHERRGLLPGVHYLEAADRDAFRRIVARLHATPDAWDRVRVQGHHAARPFAASRAWPRIVADLLASAP
jgi:hypothetical protein